MSKKTADTSFAEISGQIRIMFEKMNLVRNFKISQSIKDEITSISTCVREGDMKSALKRAKEVLLAGHNILRAFLRNAVVDRPEKMSYLTREIGLRRVEWCYHEDLVATMESMRRKYEEVVLAEGGDPDFTLRITAYNEAIASIEKADHDQELRERLRLSRDKFKKVSKMAIERDKANASMQRERLIAERNEMADAILKLIS